MKILSVKYGTAEHDVDHGGVIILTEEAGAVATCTRDAPYSGGAWEAMQDWLGAGNVIEDHPERQQYLDELAIKGGGNG